MYVYFTNANSEQQVGNLEFDEHGPTLAIFNAQGEEQEIIDIDMEMAEELAKNPIQSEMMLIRNLPEEKEAAAMRWLETFSSPTFMFKHLPAQYSLIPMKLTDSTLRTQ